MFTRIYASLDRMMKDSATRDLFMKQHADPIFTTPSEMIALIEGEYGRFAQAVKLAGLSIQ